MLKVYQQQQNEKLKQSNITNISATTQLHICLTEIHSLAMFSTIYIKDSLILLILFVIEQIVFLCFQSLVDECPANDPDTEINVGCLTFKVFSYLV